MQVMMARDDEKKLSDLIELDDACLGGHTQGASQAEGKTPFVAAVETTNLRMLYSDQIIGC